MSRAQQLIDAKLKGESLDEASTSYIEISRGRVTVRKSSVYIDLEFEKPVDKKEFQKILDYNKALGHYAIVPQTLPGKVPGLVLSYMKK